MSEPTFEDMHCAMTDATRALVELGHADSGGHVWHRATEGDMVTCRVCGSSRLRL